MTSADYWQQRALQNATRVYKYSDRQGQMVTRWFQWAAREMEEKIRGYCQSVATENGLLPGEAKGVLTDTASIKKLAASYKSLLAMHPNDPVAKQLLDLLHTSRLLTREQALLAQLNRIATEVFGKYENATMQTMTSLFEESYYKSFYDQQQFVGFGSGFNRLSTNFIAAAAGTAWSGKNYSQRIWGDHRTSLARYMNRIVTMGAIAGKPNRVMAAELQKAMSMSAYNARRLIRTESSAVSARGNLLAYQSLGTEQFKFLATLDFKTSEVCRALDGKVFPVEEGLPGVNMNPMHPFCRSTTVPYWPDEEFDSDNTRAARDGKGNTYRVPADMTYREWYKKYVESSPEEQLAETKYKRGRVDAAQWANYRQTLGKDAPNSLDKFQNIKYTDSSGYSDLKREYRHTNYYKTHLTHEEQAAVNRYISGDSYPLNAKLRVGAVLTEGDHAFIAQLDSALGKMPIYQGTVMRTMDANKKDFISLIKKAKSGETLVFPAYTSATTLPDYHTTPNVQMTLLSKSARDLRSINKTEQEILFCRNTRFRVLRAGFTDGKFIIEAEEIE